MQRTPSFYSIPAKIINPATGFILADLNGTNNSFQKHDLPTLSRYPGHRPGIRRPGKIPRIYECCTRIENTRKLLIIAETTANPVPKNKA